MANSIAALLLYTRDQTDKLPLVYFSWTEGNPAVNVLRYLIFGDGEVAPVTREVLRHAEPDPGATPGGPRGLMTPTAAGWSTLLQLL